MTGPTVTKSVQVVPYDELWASTFEAERGRLEEILRSAAIAIHHVGSTSVPGLCAKPIIDVLVEATDLELIDLRTAALEQHAYQAKGEFGIPGRRYFSRPPRPTHLAVHVHTFAVGDVQIERHLRFRDYLRSHPDEASKYCALKQRLAAAHAEDRDSYQAGKAELVRQLDWKAEKWRLRLR